MLHFFFFHLTADAILNINHSAGRPFGGPYKKNVSADHPVLLYVCMFLYLFFIPFFFLGLYVTKNEIYGTYTARKNTSSA